jgi:ParB family chromosome partitioning protein
MDSIVIVSPFRCRMWELHDRLESHINEHSCKAEIASFDVHGQLVPVLGRRLQGDANHDIELIYGARRLFVARHLNKLLQVQLRDMTDVQAIIAMDIENRQRRNVSPYEQGIAYAQWLREKYFQSQDDIARALQISASQVSRLLKIARLPVVIVNAFGNPLDIRENWGLDLCAACEDEKRKPSVIAKARELASSDRRPPAPDVYRILLASATQGRPEKKRSHDEVVTDEHGNAVFRIRHQRKTFALLLPVERMPASVMSEVKRSLLDILQRRSLGIMAPVRTSTVAKRRQSAASPSPTAAP